MRVRNYMEVMFGAVLLFSSVTSGAWTLEENFDDKPVGVRPSPFWDDGADTAVSAEKSFSGNQSLKLSTTAGNTKMGGGFVAPSIVPEGGEVWFRFRAFFPIGFDWRALSDGNRLKWIRMTVKDGNTPGRLDWYFYQSGVGTVILERDQCTTDCWQDMGDSSVPVRGVWETWEIYAKFDHTSVSNGGQGITRAWKNGVLVGEQRLRPTMWPGATEFNNFMIISHWNGGSPKTQHMYIDDMIATSDTPAARDSAGNPYIGVGKFVVQASPVPPTDLH